MSSVSPPLLTDDFIKKNAELLAHSPNSSIREFFGLSMIQASHAKFKAKTLLGIAVQKKKQPVYNKQWILDNSEMILNTPSSDLKIMLGENDQTVGSIKFRARKMAGQKTNNSWALSIIEDKDVINEIVTAPIETIMKNFEIESEEKAQYLKSKALKQVSKPKRKNAGVTDYCVIDLRKYWAKVRMEKEVETARLMKQEFNNRLMEKSNDTNNN